ncbi:MAG TPA: zf-HC2 domain-containing protein [Steroidobacteraceae bacterium]|jgi:anti-sigma factor RsiW|nr:zf-HC2 domain-containing protein [Steroidobacteraceae bacterium]
MKCEEARPLIESYLDGELDRGEVDRIEAHLSGCAHCRAELAELERLRGALRALPRQPAPAQLRRRLAQAGELPALDVPSRGALRTGWWAMAASLLLGLALGAGFMHWRGPARVDARELLVRDLLASHLRALAAASPVDVVSEDRHTVKPWFAGKIGESPPVIDPQSEEFPLLGGRIDYVGGRRTAVVVYGHRKHVIDVYITPGLLEADGAQLQGYAFAPCRLAGQSAWIVSDVDPDSLQRFRELLGCGGQDDRRAE